MKLLKVSFPYEKITPLAIKSITAAYFRGHKNRPSMQEAFLFSHIQKHADTAFGSVHDLSRVDSVEAFQRAIPLQHYESIYPRIERCLRGEKDILVRGKIDRFATSSGTTGKNKYIPVTKAALKYNHYRAGTDMIMAYARENPTTKMWPGQALGIGG